MFCLRYSLIAVLAVVALGSVVPAPVAAEDEQPLINILQSDAPKAEKAITCKKLAVWGSGDCVPAVAALLDDPELTSWARIALEVIPDPAADQALREAMGRLEGRSLIGVINSIGVRQDESAVDALIERMGGSDADVASASAAALGHIGNEAATAALEKALGEVPEEVRSAVAEGCILCAERLLSDGSAEEAARLYDEVRAADLPKQRIVEATRGAILARGADGIPLLVEQLNSSDKVMVALGLTAARELAGPGVSKNLVNALNDIAPDLQALLILAMADRGDAEAMPAMLEAVKSGPPAVRIAAIEVLKSIGDASSVPVLLQIAAEDDADVAAAAIATLTALPGDEVDADLVARLGAAAGAERLALIELVGARRIDAVPPLIEAIDDSDAAVRAAALKALGQVAKLDNVSVLIERVVDPPQAEDAEVALEALKAACIRMPDREACAGQLAAALDQATAGAKDAILDTLKEMGGQTALDTVAKMARSEDAQLQDTATRILGQWMTADAGPVLLELANDPNCRYQVRALRGYIRLPRQFGSQLDDAQRVDMCEKAWQAAQRDAERELVLQVIERYPSVGMLRLAVRAAEQSSTLQENAKAVAISVAQKISGSADVKDLLEQIKGDPVEIEILKATYGAGDKQKDVTAVLKNSVGDLPLIVLPQSNYNAAFGGDPAQGVVKQLKIQYRLNGKEGEAVFEENAAIILPVPQ
jgi:HEAT repeat protein